MLLKYVHLPGRGRDSDDKGVLILETPAARSRDVRQVAKLNQRIIPVQIMLSCALPLEKSVVVLCLRLYQYQLKSKVARQ
jgi:hypothetical protein